MTSVITRLETKVFTWIDVQNPTLEEVVELQTEFKFDQTIAEELAQNIERSKVRFFSTHTYVVLQFPTSEGVVLGGKKTEVDFIIGTTFLITVHYEKVGSVNDVATNISEAKQLKTTRGLFFDIVYKQYRKIGRQLEDMDILIQETEQKIFGEKQNKTVEKISEVNQKILDFKRALRFHKDIWRQLEENVLFRENAELLTNEYQKIWNALEHYQEITLSLQGTNDSLIAYRTSDAMKALMVLNCIVLTISVIPTTLTLVESPQGQLLTIGGFIVICILIYYSFKEKSRQ
jgi:Mg2+ and Co2+ transporter CorA